MAQLPGHGNALLACMSQIGLIYYRYVMRSDDAWTIVLCGQRKLSYYSTRAEKSKFITLGGAYPATKGPITIIAPAYWA